MKTFQIIKIAENILNVIICGGLSVIIVYFAYRIIRGLP